MATNPLFQGYKKSDIFNIKTVNNRSSYLHFHSSIVMAQPGSRDSTGAKRAVDQDESGDNKPDSKKRKVEQNAADSGDEWDESFEFTQKDLETLDVAASQAIEQQTASKEGHVQKSDQTLELDTTVTAATGAGQSSLFVTPAPGMTVRLKNRSSTSSSAESLYPHSSASFRKTPSLDMSSAAGSLTSHKSFSSHSSGNISMGDHTVLQTGMTAQSRADTNIVLITSLREQLRKKEEEMRSSSYARDGEVKLLKDSLHKREMELERLRSQQDQERVWREQQQKEAENEVKQELERLKIEMQFKNQDLQQLQQKCRALESKHGQSPSVPQPSTSSAGVIQSQPSVSPSKSPKVRKVQPTSAVAADKDAFPSRQSFMTGGPSPKPGPAGAGPGGDVVAPSRGTVTGADSRPSPQQDKLAEWKERKRRLQLKVLCPGGQTPGNQLVSRLLHCSCSASGEIEDSGILGLLQSMASRLDLTELQYERVEETAKLSPIKKSRKILSPGASQPASQSSPAKPVVRREHFLMAAQGLRDLITSHTEHTPMLIASTASSHQASASVEQASEQASASTSKKPGIISKDVTPGKRGSISKEQPSTSRSQISRQQTTVSRELLPSSGEQATTSGEQISSSTELSKRSSSSPELKHPNGAVLLLPMLNDYLAHYMDILASNIAVSGKVSSSPSESIKTSSGEVGSSLESVSSSLGVLLQEGAHYANSMETLTLSALRVLRTLVCSCQDVRQVCLQARWETSAPLPVSDASSSAAETDRERDKNESGMEGDDECSSLSSKQSPVDHSASPASSLRGLNLLVKLVRLASPSQESSGFNATIVEAAFDVLFALAVNISDADVFRLSVIVLRGVIGDCLSLPDHPSITLRALDLFSSLVRSDAILPLLCTKSDSCTLLCVHLVVTRLLATCRGHSLLPPPLVNTISKVIYSLSSVVSHHRQGVIVLTGNKCKCSAQVVPSLVLAMFYLVEDYQISRSDRVFSVLRRGELLLHNISLRDANFQQHCGPVQIQYSLLVSELVRIYKDRTDIPKAEVSELALEDLAEDFEGSDSGSQGSDHDEPMVVQ